MGYYSRINSGVKTEGVVPRHAGDLHQGDHTGQAGAEEPLRVSRVHDQGAGSNTYLDIQPQNKGKTCKMGSCWSSITPSNLRIVCLLSFVI